MFSWIAERIGYTWIGWTSLAAGFLAASLLIFAHEDTVCCANAKADAFYLRVGGPCR